MTQREIEDEKFRKKHEAEQKIIKDQQNKVEEYLDFMIKRIDFESFIHALDKPIEQDPLKVLACIQAYEDDISTLMAMGESTGTLAE